MLFNQGIFVGLDLSISATCIGVVWKWSAIWRDFFYMSFFILSVCWEWCWWRAAFQYPVRTKISSLSSADTFIENCISSDTTFKPNTLFWRTLWDFLKTYFQKMLKKGNYFQLWTKFQSWPLISSDSFCSW